MSSRETEKIKLTATYLNGLAVAVFAVGSLAPLFFQSHPHLGDPDFWFYATLIASCSVASPILHFVARGSLEKLPDDESSDP